MSPESAPSSSQSAPAFHQLSWNAPCQPPLCGQMWARECVCTRVCVWPSFCLLNTSQGFSGQTCFCYVGAFSIFGPEIIIRVYSLSSRIINHFCMFSRVWRGLLFSHFFL